MIPPLIVQTAVEHGIQLIAITDHNASENVPAVIKAAEGLNLAVLPGMELQTEEEVHSLCLFDTMAQLEQLQKLVDEKLPGLKNNADFFGEQFIVDETGDFIKRKEQLLITSTSLSLNEAYQFVTNLGGLFIPAHINRQAFGLIYHLGFIPEDIPWDALELSRHITPKEAIAANPQLKDIPLIQRGDVHYLSDFLGVNLFTIEKPSIAEIKLALKGESNRSLTLGSGH
jgi:PHP family Zn ribbon phosphoesterase